MENNETRKSGVSRDTQAMMAFESAKKSVGVAFFLWFFLGYFGAHRFYLGRTGSGIAMFVITVISILLLLWAIGVVGFLAIFVWWVVDAFLISGIALEYNQGLMRKLTRGSGA